MKSLEAEIGLNTYSASYDGFGDELVALDMTNYQDTEDRDW